MVYVIHGLNRTDRPAAGVGKGGYKRGRNQTGAPDGRLRAGRQTTTSAHCGRNNRHLTFRGEHSPPISRRPAVSAKSARLVAANSDRGLRRKGTTVMVHQPACRSAVGPAGDYVCRDYAEQDPIVVSTPGIDAIYCGYNRQPRRLRRHSQGLQRPDPSGPTSASPANRRHSPSPDRSANSACPLRPAPRAKRPQTGRK